MAKAEAVVAAAGGNSLLTTLRAQFGSGVIESAVPAGDFSLHLRAADWLAAAERLRDSDGLKFEQLIDVSGLDLLDYGKVEWRTTASTGSGFSRGVDQAATAAGAALQSGAVPLGAGGAASHERFVVVYQLLSVSANQRLRVRVSCAGGDEPSLPSACGIWASANWFERETYDLYGIEFHGHPDLRRILTDYGFVGHPFRKDFPLIGNVEVRYDEKLQRIVYEPVSIEPRTLVPRVIRSDNRYDPALLGHVPPAAVPSGGAK